MFHFKLFHSGQELDVTCNQSIDNVMKIASHNDHVFITTAANELFYGATNESQRSQIQLDLIRNDVIDSIYAVDINGFVQHCPLMAFEFDKRWNEISILNYGAIYDGITSNGSESVRVAEVYCNNDGALFVTVDRELYGMGNFNDVCSSDQPMKVPQFINYEILQVAMGKHFVALLTRKRSAQTLHKSSHTNHIDSSSCDDTLSLVSNFSARSMRASNIDDSMNMVDTSIGNLSIHSNPSEGIMRTQTPAQDSDENSYMENLTSIQTVTNHTDVENSSSTENSMSLDVEHEVAKLASLGERIHTQIWCFGSVNKGQLGVGDHIKRTQAVEVVSLRDQGVIRLCAGDEHTAALTLDGRLYLWGDNSNEQISHCLERESCSSPKRYHKNEQNILAVQCGKHSTFILTNNLERCELSRNKHFQSVSISTERNDEYYKHQSDYLFLASKHYLIVGTTFRSLRYEKFLKYEQQFLQDILQNAKPNLDNFVRVLSRNVSVKHPHLYRQFAQQYNSITQLAAVNIASILDFARERTNYAAIAFIRHHLEFIHVLRVYTQLYCEIICSDDFSVTSQFINPNADFTLKFSIPMQHISNYSAFIVEILKAPGNDESLKIALERWEHLSTEISSMLDSANTTINFWSANQKNIPSSLQLPERRVIIDSKEYQLKLLPSSRFKTNWFVLFNDILCRSTGSSSSVKQYSLKTVWVTNVIDKDVSPSSSTSSATPPVRKYALKITTPEDQFVVSATSNEAKMRWFELLERQIKVTLGKTNTKSTLMQRTTSYTFSEKHQVYPNCDYLGQWYGGRMHGIGSVKYSDGRIYIGQMNMNAISGYGRLTIPHISCYEGRFIDGKYDGYGTLTTDTTNENYEGHFKNGLKSGFGTSIDNNRTYIGEFLNGHPSGYGVLDDSDSSEKYMGMFADGYRSGHGFCITCDGKYFEGNFVDNELNGSGVAYFTDGSYYEGDLSVRGPVGKGSLFLPIEAVQNERCIDLDSSKALMRGSILSGSLHGSWGSVKINNGNMSVNQEFGKYPSQFEQPQIDSRYKWVSLFSDWEHDVFGTSINEFSDVKKIWGRIGDYINITKQIESLKSTIATSTILNMKQHHQQHHQQQSQTDHFLHAIQANNSFDLQVSKSVSLGRISGRNYKRNLLAVERTKSISNEFLNNAVNFTADVKFSPESKSSDEKPNEKESKPNKTDDRLALPTSLINVTPCFGVTKLDSSDLRLIRDYLTKAFKNPYHPLGILNTKISYCFYTSYGCWRVKPISILSTHAMQEWESISTRIYHIVCKMFPTLPQQYGTVDEEFVSHRSLLYPILLSEGVYSTLFVLYANKCSRRDEVYRQRMQLTDKKTDEELMEFLKIPSDYQSLIRNEEFSLAIVTLRQVKEKFCPREMLQLIEQTFKHVEKAAEILNADNMMPLTIFLLLRAAIPHLGTEILLLEDLLGPDFEFIMHGFAGYCFTTIKAAYQHIINESFLQ